MISLHFLNEQNRKYHNYLKNSSQTIHPIILVYISYIGDNLTDFVVANRHHDSTLLIDMREALTTDYKSKRQ